MLLQSLAVTLLPGRSAVGLCMRFVMHHRALQEHVIGCFSNALLQEHGRAAACAEAQKLCTIGKKDPSESC